MGWDVKVVDKKWSDFKIGWIPIVLKSFVIVMALLLNVAVRKAICPFIPFAQVKRYVESVTNLICMRATLFMLGFFRFESDTFTYFRKDTTKITLKSGFIGVATHKSIIDFLYYSYILNPVFVRLVLYRKPDKDHLFYAPLTFAEALRCALYYRGFDPIIVHNEREFKNVKHRKLAMKTLVSECFEEINGPILILLPGLDPAAHVAIDKTVANDIFDNEVRFERSLVGLLVKVDERALPANVIYKNQLFVVLELLSRFRWFHLKVDAVEYRKWKHRYDRVTYPSFVDKFYQDNDYQLDPTDYADYLAQLDRLELEDPPNKQE